MCTVCRSAVIKDLRLLSRNMEHLSADLTEPGGEILLVWRDGAHRWGYAPVQRRKRTSNRSLEGLLGAARAAQQWSFWKFSAFMVCENLTQWLWFSAVRKNMKMEAWAPRGKVRHRRAGESCGWHCSQGQADDQNQPWGDSGSRQ